MARSHTNDLQAGVPTPAIQGAATPIAVPLPRPPSPGCYAKLSEKGSPVASLLRKEHHCREPPSDAHWFGGMRQIWQVDHPAIWAGLRFGSSNAGTGYRSPIVVILTAQDAN